MGGYRAARITAFQSFFATCKAPRSCGSVVRYPNSKSGSLRFHFGVFDDHVGNIVFDSIHAPALGAFQALSVCSELNGQLTCRANQNVQKFLRNSNVDPPTRKRNPAVAACYDRRFVLIMHLAFAGEDTRATTII